MENFIEYSLPYKLTAQDQLKRMLCIFVPLLAGVGLIMWLGLLGILLCAVLCYISYRLFVGFYYELEYSLLENEITFSKIINKERRRELLKADIAKTERYGLLENLPKQAGQIYSFLSHQGEEPAYYWITGNEKGEKLCILFQPNEAVLEVFSVRARGKMQ